MNAASPRQIIAYLAPEIPALSATFVYEEMLGLARRGVTVIPVSVHRPHQPAENQAELASRVRYLYQGSRAKQLLAGLIRLPFQSGAWKALGWLRADIVECGPLRPASWKLAYQFLVAVRLAELLKQEQCTHLHVHFAHVPTQIAMYAAALSGVPFTIMAHANDIFERGLLLRRKAERAVKMLTISAHNIAYLKSVGVPAEKLAIVRCGVSFAARPTLPVAARREIYRIGSLGRLVEKKGMDVLIRALAALRDKPYRIELSIAGDGPLRGELERLVEESGLTGTVQFVGSLAHHQVREWMHGLDAFVLACKQDANGDMDGIPVVLMEAMSQSVPVISTRLSGIPELVVDAKTGLLAEPGNPADLAARIDQLLGSTELRDALSAAARTHVEREFGQPANLDRLIGHMGLATRALATRQ